MGDSGTDASYLPPNLSIEFWKSRLEALEPCMLRRLTTGLNVSTIPTNRSVRVDLDGILARTPSLSLRAVSRVAWASVLRVYTASDHVSFGYLGDGISKPTNITPCSIRFEGTKTLLQMVEDAQLELIGELPHRHVPLVEVARTLGVEGDAFFNTSMVFRPHDSTRTTQPDDLAQYDLIVDVNSEWQCSLRYQDNFLSDEQASHMASALSLAFTSIADFPHQEATSMELFSESDQTKLAEWNSMAPVASDLCLDAFFEKHCQSNPDAPAVASWDGCLTYKELDCLSSNLAHQLRAAGVRPGVFVPICYERCKWIPVAMLGIVKAGGAFCALEPSYPKSRLAHICQSLKSTVILMMENSAPQVHGLVVSTITVGDSLWAHSEQTLVTLPPARPENALYTVFTSGTTGQPKGIIHEHRSFCSSAMASLEPLSIGPQDRLLHFASYAFDLSIFEILTAFIAGASVAIPRDEDRLKRLPEAATELQATWAFLTPTVARLYKPEEFTTLRTLSLGGEAINAVDVEKWSCKNLITGYNPAECTPLGISGPADHLAANFLGWSFKSQAAWIVNPRDYEKLIPIGAIGELLIEGPAVARGYVHEQSSPSCDSPFIRSAPSWLSHFRSNPTATSLYRTGDLVQYGRNGALHFIGRKDLQVKVRGQRIEPAEIEHNVYKALMSYAAKVMVDVIAFGDRTTLVAFILPRQHADTGSTAHLSQAPQLQEQTSEFASLIYKANSELRRKLPSYMVPAMYLPVGHIPMSRSGKIDRNQLKEFASSLSPSTLDRVRNGRCIPEEAPKTDMECLLQRLFAEVLGVSLTQITADSDFFLLGGDSILSMKLLAMMTQEGFELTFKNIVKYPRLREMALAVVPSDQRSSAADEIEPFSLVQDVERIRESICEQLDVPMDQVQDIYPCTPLQAGLMASTAHDPNAYVALQSFTLVDEINVQRLKEAWNIVAEAHPILRTRIVQSEAGDSYQVILRGPLPCSETSDEPSSQPAIGLGTPLIHLCFTPDRLLVYMHHALYDGWSLPRLLHDVEQAYLSGAVTQRPSFNRFVQHVQKSMESATSFWEAELQEADLVHFPVPRSPNHKPDPRSIKTRSMTLPTVTKPQNTVTLATEIQLAWAVTSHSYTRSRDVIFGMVSTGRATHVGGIEAILGPTIASTPLRVSIDPAQEVREALEDVQYSSIERTEYEHMNTQLIARHVPSAAEACKFQTMLVVEPEGEQDTQGSWFTKHEFLSDLVQFSSHSLTLRCKLHPGAIEAMAIFDPSVVSETQMQRILAQFQHILTQIHVTKTDTTIGDIMMLSPEDWHEVQGWNATLPRRVDRCAHHLVQAKCQSQPEALAIHSWDGDLTYGELDDRVQKLARHLRSLPEVAPNTFIGIYLERSLWAVVAQLAVLKAGAAFITLETSQPPTRLRDICATVEPVALLTSGNLRSAATGIYSSAPIVMVNQPLLCRENGQDNENMKPQSVGPTDAMYGIATSGTTGKPKVVVIEHQAFATNHEPLMKRLGLTSESRVLQFSAYSFDAMIVEHFITLIAGGCICIPSRFDRDNSLTKSINAMHVNWAMLTASVIPILVPASVPTLRTLVQGGEPLHRGIIDSWSSHVKLLNAYGPSECTVICVIQGPIHQNARNPKNIGFGLGGLCWIVDPEHPDSPLVPVGAEGELVIEGSILARGYMKVPEHAAAAFTSRPPWLDDLRSGNGENRIYKTGDIVRYEPDGSICHVRRKDTQLKIRGQRVELQEVEHHVHSCFPGALQVVADMVSLHGDSEGEKSTFLVALVLTNDARSSNISKSASVQTAGVNPLLPANNSKFLRDVRSAEQALGDTVPTYMIPQLFLPVSHISRDPNGKVDRREICRLLTGLSHNEWDAYASTTGVEPSTDVERQLQTIWARVLKVSPQSIGIHDSFFRLGGNSISSMQLVARCTTAGIPICVNDVFEQRTIQKLAAAVAVAQNSGSSGSQPLDPAKDEPGPAGLSELKQCIDRIQPQLAGSVENIYPCSPIQRGILISHARNPGYYDQSIRWKVRSPAPVDIDRLRDAWAQVVLRHAVLRTIFLDVSGQGYLDQVVLKDYFPVIHICQQAELEADSPLPTGDHQPMQHLQISQSTVGVVTLRLHINHALVDGHSLYIIKRDLALAYEGHLALRSAPSPYRDYVMFLEKAYTHNQSREFWKSRLQGMPPCQFPRLNDSNAPDPPRPFQAATVELAPTHDLTEFCEHHGLALTSLLHTVWAIVVQRYTATDDVSFGYMTSARHLPLAGIQDIVGPLFNMLVARVLLPRDTDALSVMKQYQGNFVASLDHQHQAFAETLQDIESNPGDLFNTLVSIFNDSDDGEGQQSSGIFLEGDDVHNQSEYPITMNILIRPDQAHLMLTYHTSLLNDKYAMIVAKTFRHVLVTLLKHPQTLLHEVDVLDEEQRAIVSERNQTLVAPLESCIHHTIHERALAHPNNPAVCAWDGDFSHGILDQLSSSLADELIHEGIGADNTIPVLLEKTRWTPVAMLAILKSGASFVLMDAGHPLERLQTIIEATRAPLVIASPTTLSKANKLSPRVIELTDMLSKQYQPGKEFQWPGVSIKEQDAAYVVFTSGSTGVPKGAVVAHSSLETAAEHLQSCLYVDSSTRVLQFSSHAWDIPVTDILLTLRAGGCVCIPSDEDRTGDIAQAANRLMANWALLTPTVARLVRPEDFTSLKTLVLAGEAISPADLATWHDKVRLIQGYGPAECSLISTVSVPMTLSTDPRGIGQPNACAAWIVHRDNHNLLAPAGAIGELILEGPIVARGYINNPEQTAAAFIEAPSWLKRLRNESTPLRLYKTGDLVRSGLDGSLFFVGRKDNQVKIRGQRVELGEVEALVSRAFSGSQVVVELIKKPELTLFLAFILQEAAKDCTNLLHPPSSEFQESINAIFPRMRELMPSYMIPSVFLPLTHLPRTPTGKTDRRRLRDHIATLSSTELDSYSPVNTFQCVASTPHEAQLQTYVGGVLQRPAETIPLDEDLFTIGLDSLKAMTLAATARKDGMVISVPTIFQHPRLCDLAIVLTQSQATVGEKVLKMQPNSLIASLDEVCAQWHLERDQILNIIPATYFQRGSIETLHAGYIAFHFARPLDVAKFQEVVKMAVSKHAILRTAFIPFQETFVQLVLRDVNIPVQEISTDEDDPSLVTESLCREIERTPLCFGVPAIKLILIQSRTSGRMTAVLRLNRGQYDGISVKCIIEELMSDFEDAHDAPAPGLEYSDFILGRAAYNTESVFQEWRELLEGSSMTYMVPPDQCIRTTDRSRSELLVTAVSDIPLPTTKGGITMASVAKAAWALCLASQTRSDDLVFAQLVRIRHLPMEGIERTVGPCLNYIPVRVSLKPEWTGMDLLRWVQRQHVRTMTSDTADWDEIVQKSTSWPRDTELGSAVHYLSAPMGGHYVFPGDIPCRVHPFDFKMMHTYPMVTCIQFPSAEDPPAINLRIMLTSAVFDQSMADHLCSRFQDLLMQLACDPEKLVSSML